MELKKFSSKDTYLKSEEMFEDMSRSKPKILNYKEESEVSRHFESFSK
jgi:hypothetical protein